MADKTQLGISGKYSIDFIEPSNIGIYCTLLYVALVYVKIFVYDLPGSHLYLNWGREGGWRQDKPWRRMWPGRDG